MLDHFGILQQYLEFYYTVWNRLDPLPVFPASHVRPPSDLYARRAGADVSENNTGSTPLRRFTSPTPVHPNGA